jgi:RimJ/RimL family protein N-acetyltransferase
MEGIHISTDTTLKTKRLFLRYPELADATEISAVVESPRFPERLPLKEMNTVSAIEQWLKGLQEGWGKGQAFSWVVEGRDSGKTLGQVTLSKAKGDNLWALAFWVRPEDWGKGYATEAVERLLAFGFEELGAPRIWAGAGNKVAVLATMEGALALGEGPCPESLVNLRALYRLGLRSLQFVGQGWNCLTDASGDEWPSKGLTPLGKDVVREMNRLGMVIDMAHVPDPDPLFWDVIEIGQDPIVDSHRCVRGANDIPRNITDERIKAIAETGGVVGLQFFSSTLASGEAGGIPRRATLARNDGTLQRPCGMDGCPPESGMEER